ncbi:MAG: glycosyltransferase family 39 protein [Abitibacteriaceae bacterium]|nr:glycosyltransferase family 39 protein [Abditibacteriaceae bacterium]
MPVSSNPKPRTPNPTPFLLFLLSALPRFIGLHWGLPSQSHWYSYHPDERQILEAVSNLNLFQGQFNPHFFNYPTLYIYLVHLGYILGSGLGLTHPAASNPALIWTWMADVLLIGRVITALFGAATVSLVYLIGRDLKGHRIGLIAALMLAFLPGHVQHSHFATVDVPATFFITLSLWSAIHALLLNEQDADDVAATATSANHWRTKQLLLAAFAAGLAAATKYNAGLVVIAPLLALYLGQKHNFWKILAPLMGLAALGFFVGCPYSLLSPKEFWGDGQTNGVAFEILVHPRLGSGNVFQATGNGWWYHLTFNLPFVMTWPLLLIALAGVITLFVPTPHQLAPASDSKTRISAPIVLLLAWTALYFFSLGFSQVRFMRYTLPLVPTLSLFGAMGIAKLMILIAKDSQGATQPSRLSMLITSCLLLIAALGTSNVLFPFITPDPRDQAAQFLATHTSGSTTVGLLTPPWFWTPPLTPQNASRRADVSDAELSQLSSLSPQHYHFMITGFSSATLEQNKPEWFVMSEEEWREEARLHDPQYEAFMQQLAQSYDLKASFKNVPPLALPGRAFVPHDFLYTNPEVRVYQRR